MDNEDNSLILNEIFSGQTKLERFFEGFFIQLIKAGIKQSD